MEGCLEVQLIRLSDPFGCITVLKHPCPQWQLFERIKGICELLLEVSSKKKWCRQSFFSVSFMQITIDNCVEVEQIAKDLNLEDLLQNIGDYYETDTALSSNQLIYCLFWFK